MGPNLHGTGATSTVTRKYLRALSYGRRSCGRQYYSYGAVRGGLREVEAGKPEDDGSAVVDPLLEELQPLEQVGDVRAEWLERGVGLGHPHRGDGARRERDADGLEVGRHHDEPFQRRPSIINNMPS